MLNSKLSGNFPIYCENKLIILRLAEQIHYRIRILTGFDLGTQYTFSPECGLARGNPQWPAVLDLVSESKIAWFNFLVDLKAQSTHLEKIF